MHTISVFCKLLTSSFFFFFPPPLKYHWALPFNLPQCWYWQNTVASVILFPLLCVEAKRFWGVLEGRAASCSVGFPSFLVCFWWATWLLGSTPPAIERPLWSRPLGRWKLGKVLGCLKGSKSQEGRVAQSRHIWFTPRHPSGSHRALVSCSALGITSSKVADGGVVSTNLPLRSQSLLYLENTRLPLLTWANVRPCYWSVFPFFLSCTLPVRSPCASLKKWINTWIFIPVNMLLLCTELEILLKCLMLLFGFEIFQIGSHRLISMLIYLLIQDAFRPAEGLQSVLAALW